MAAKKAARCTGTSATPKCQMLNRAGVKTPRLARRRGWAFGDVWREIDAWGGFGRRLFCAQGEGALPMRCALVSSLLTGLAMTWLTRLASGSGSPCPARHPGGGALGQSGRHLHGSLDCACRFCESDLDSWTRASECEVATLASSVACAPSHPVTWAQFRGKLFLTCVHALSALREHDTW